MDMRVVLRQLGVLLFIGVVILVPTFELFDQGEDLEQGADFVQAFLWALTAGMLAVLLTRIVAILFGWFQLFEVPCDRMPMWERRPGVESSPPELSLAVHTIRI